MELIFIKLVNRIEYYYFVHLYVIVTIRFKSYFSRVKICTNNFL